MMTILVIFIMVLFVGFVLYDNFMADEMHVIRNRRILNSINDFYNKSKVSIPELPEIVPQIGKYYSLKYFLEYGSDKGNPFKKDAYYKGLEKTPTYFKVLDVKDGWVQYEYNKEANQIYSNDRLYPYENGMSVVSKDGLVDGEFIHSRSIEYFNEYFEEYNGEIL